MFNIKENKNTIDMQFVGVSSIILSVHQNEIEVILEDGKLPFKYLKYTETASNILKQICKEIFDFNTDSPIDYLAWTIVAEPHLFEDKSNSTLTVCYGVILQEKIA